MHVRKALFSFFICAFQEDLFHLGGLNIQGRVRFAGKLILKFNRTDP